MNLTRASELGITSLGNIVGDANYQVHFTNLG